MGTMFFFILFNYTILRSLKDSLLVPNIGAEAIGFVKMYVITPAALSFMVLYAYLTHIMTFDKVFYWIGGFFLFFFLSFAFVIYPFQDFFHPTNQAVNALINGDLHLASFTIKLDHFKWFLKLYEKWTFVVFYVVAELWGAAMVFLLYWQLANSIIATEEAKRMFPMCAFIGHAGTFLGGAMVQYTALDMNSTIQIFDFAYPNKIVFIVMIAASVSLVITLFLFQYVKNHIVGKEHMLMLNVRKPHMLKSKLSLMESFKIVLSTKYLWLLMMLVLCYGTCINLSECVWKDKAKLLYTDTNQFAYFMGDVLKWVGICTMFTTIIGSHILRKLGWLFGAMLTPIVMLVTGVLFFVFVLFEDFFAPYVSEYLGLSPLVLAVFLGTMQNIFTKATKYSVFDATKEMTYIPASEQIRSKGKAAVDVVGNRWGKSVGAFIQSMLFMIFPTASYSTITPYLMVMFVILVGIWILNVKKLHIAYTAKLAEHSS